MRVRDSRGPARSRRRSRRLLRTALVVVVLLGAAAWLADRELHLPPPPGCVATAGTVDLSLDFDQAADAATVAAEALRLRLPDQAVTVAFTAALQESGLHDLDYGDRDSVGIFQQRPSQGWGPRTSLLDPAYASTAFYRRLVQVAGWQKLDAGAAAQAVQRSATPTAYSQWEPQAQLLTEVFTGRVPAGLACAFSAPSLRLTAEQIALRADSELGAPGVRAITASAAGWAAAAWLVAQAHGLGVTAVSYDGQSWSPAAGRWTSAAGAGALSFSAAP